VRLPHPRAQRHGDGGREHDEKVSHPGAGAST